MKPVCIIPARGGSKGVRKKNIRKIGGKPLIAYTIEKSIQSKIFSHVVVSSEDKEIALIASEIMNFSSILFLEISANKKDRIVIAMNMRVNV